MDIEEIWSQYQSNIKSFLYSRIPTPEDVDDLHQDVFIKTYRNLHTIKSEKSIKSWLFQTANNSVIDFYRKKGKLNELEGFDDGHWSSENSASVLQELSGCLKPFIAALPEGQASLLTAIEINGQSQKEYAETHGISYSTLKSRVQKARAELRKVFETCCQFTFDQQGNVLEYMEKSDYCKDC